MILILDTETTGLDPKKDHLIEVGAARFDECLGQLVECRSWMVHPFRLEFANTAIDVNGILEQTIKRGAPGSHVAEELNEWSGQHRCVVAHNASFDQKWFTQFPNPWVCSEYDIEWPKDIGSGSLEKLALAHGIGVMPGHRAIYDVLTLVRVFERVAEMGRDLEAMITKAMLPKSLFQSKHPFASNDTASKAGFRWDGDRKAWCRKMTDDAAKLLQSTYPYNIYKLES